MSAVGREVGILSQKQRGWHSAWASCTDPAEKWISWAFDERKPRKPVGWEVDSKQVGRWETPGREDSGGHGGLATIKGSAVASVRVFG